MAAIALSEANAASTASARGSISAVIAVRNEARNLERCLCALSFCSEIVVVDSGSVDGTPGIAESLGARVLQFRYEGGYPKKRQWALDHGELQGEWVLVVDADEVVSPELAREIQSKASGGEGCNAYLGRKTFHFQGRRFRFGGFSHEAVLLFRKGFARYEESLRNPPVEQDMEVHERLIVDGSVSRLRGLLIHEDFKGLEAYIARHNHYSSWEARLRHQYLRTGTWGKETVQPRLLGNPQERRRWLKQWVLRCPVEPLLWFGYHYVFRLGFLEARPGLLAARLRSNYIADVRAKLRELNQWNTESAQLAEAESQPLMQLRQTQRG